MRYITPLLEVTFFEKADIVTVSNVGDADYNVGDGSNVGNTDIGDIDW